MFRSIFVGSIALAAGSWGLIVATTSIRGVELSDGGVRRELATELEACYDYQECWSGFPGQGIQGPRCSLTTPDDTLCSCEPNTSCKFSTSANDDFTVAYCKTTTTFFVMEGKARSVGSYCTNHRTLDQWKKKGLAATDTRKDLVSKSWWQICPSGYSMESSSTCRLSKRLVGMTCWDGWFGRGECETGEGEYKVSCHKADGESEATCKPFILGLERNKCECSVWHIGGWCIAKEQDGQDPCNGHWCKMNGFLTDNYACSYDSGQH